MLGTPGEYNRYKIYYIAFMIIVIAYLAFAWIGQPSIERKQMVSFYAWFGLVALIFIIFDNLTKKRFQLIDTVTIEKTPVSLKIILGFGLAIGVIFGARIFTTHQAWVGYPQFQLFDSRYANALLSGIAGVIENWVFFGWWLPTVYAVLEKKVFGNPLMSSAVSVLIISFVFMIYHTFVYATNEMALLSVFLFGAINATLVVFLRTIVVSDILHFTNNFVATLVNAGVALVW